MMHLGGLLLLLLRLQSMPIDVEGTGKQAGTSSHHTYFLLFQHTAKVSLERVVPGTHTHNLHNRAHQLRNTHRESTYKASLVHHRRQQQRHLAPSNLVVIRSQPAVLELPGPIKIISIIRVEHANRAGSSQHQSVLAACHVQIVCQPLSYRARRSCNSRNKTC